MKYSSKETRRFIVEARQSMAALLLAQQQLQYSMGTMETSGLYMDQQIGLMLADMTKIKATEIYLSKKVDGLIKFTNKMSYKPTNVPKKFIWRVQAIEKKVAKL